MAEQKTIFARIIDREIPAEIVHEDDLCFAFNDVNPQAPVHVLVIPKKPIVSLAEITAEDTELIGHLFQVVRQLAEQHNLQGGFRTIINTGDEGGQTVPHLHIHLLGGRSLSWPPG